MLADLPPPQNRQVRLTLKSPSPIYPQIVCTIYPPPPKLPSLIDPQIIFGDLPPPQIAKSDLPYNRQVQFTLKSSVWFTPPTPPPPQKLPSLIYPQIVFGGLPPPKIAKSDLPSNWGGKSYRRFEGKSDLVISGGKSYRQFEGKSDLAISGG